MDECAFIYFIMPTIKQEREEEEEEENDDDDYCNPIGISHRVEKFMRLARRMKVSRNE